MIPYGKASLIAAAMTVTVVSGAGAQANKCDINESKPYQLASAKQYLGIVNSPSGNPGERPKHLRNAVKVLTENADRIDNQAGRQWLLGRTLFAWSQQPALGWSPSTVGRVIVKRGELGYTENPDEPIDIIETVDKAFDAVEAAEPACVAEVMKYRRQFWVPLVNTATALANQDQLDSARVLVEKSMVLIPNSPIAYNVLGFIAQKKNDPAMMKMAFQKVIETSAGDTSMAKQRQQAMYNLATLYVTEAEALEGEAQKTALQEARRLYETYLAERPDDTNAQAARARVLQLQGDTAAVAGIFAEMLANPAKYTDLQLFEAGVGAARAERWADAAKLFEQGLAKNPYYRDALFNLANVYFSAKQYDKMLPIVQRLVTVDPANPDNYRLLAGAYQGLSKVETNAQRKKAQQDSLLRYLELSEKMESKVAFSAFRHQGAKHTLSGFIENLGKAAATYPLKVEFLDAQGNVVATKEVSVGPVQPGQTAEFQVEVEQSGIAAFRYSLPNA